MVAMLRNLWWRWRNPNIPRWINSGYDSMAHVRADLRARGWRL